ncbi:Large ribosomal subunit protein bL31m [Nakaseomyces bracarensis]|uniref:Large ribosomal subunit protein bL31m n=1 Tax=Nakaseomyces bracarensis TaxID=273131 RepID=A0ABR4NPT5_9SACH
MFRSTIWKRLASTGGHPNATKVSLPRRPLKKIRLGKARPAIYHQFKVKVELSDGSVITRRSQFPKDEIRLISDQRNSPLWNPSRDDLVVVDVNSGGSKDKFKQKYSSIFSMDEKSDVIDESAIDKKETKTESKSQPDNKVKEAEPEEDAFGVDDYLSLLDDNTKQIKTGRLVQKKKKDKK